METARPTWGLRAGAEDDFVAEAAGLKCGRERAHAHGSETPTTVCSTPCASPSRSPSRRFRGPSRHQAGETDDADSVFEVALIKGLGDVFVRVPSDSGSVNLAEEPIKALDSNGTTVSTAASDSDEQQPALETGRARSHQESHIQQEGDAAPAVLAQAHTSAARRQRQDVVRTVLAQAYTSAARHQRLPRRRHDSLCTFGSHVSWNQLLDLLGDSEEAWRGSKVHRWLGVGEDVALSLLSELIEVRQMLAQEEQAATPAAQGPAVPVAPAAQEPRVAQRSGGWGLISWLFGARAPPGPRRVAHEATVRYDLDRLSELGTLGHGAFGSVRLMKDAATGQVMALKSVSKGMLVEAGLQTAIKAEKEVMQATDSPFLVRLAACFDRDQELFFLLEPATGGDLYTIYRWKDFFGFEDHARFYVACMTCAFAHLHSRGILYRDLKMENVVLDSQGYAKLCDFGTSTFADRAFTMCGTPEYMAPEVFSGSGHGPAADWWTLGVLCFEMIMARTPFVDDNPMEIFHKAREGIDSVELPEGKQWASLVRGLCQLDPAQRLPMLPEGLQQFQSQEWWAAAGFDWSSLEAQTMIPPHVPTLTGPDDLHNFNCEGQEEPPRVTFYDCGEGWFEGFEDAVGPVLQRGLGHTAAPPTPKAARWALDA